MTTSKHTVARWFQKFRSRENRFQDEEDHGRYFVFDNEQFKKVSNVNTYVFPRACC